MLDIAQAVERRVLAWPSGPSQDEIKEFEHKADRIVSELISQSNSLFVTPFDRDDLITLAFARTSRHRGECIRAVRPLRRLVADEAVDPSSAASSCVRPSGSRSCSPASSAGGLGGRSARSTIKEIEDEADDVARAARASLFKDDRIDPVIVIVWKDIYEALEDAVDACDTAAYLVGEHPREERVAVR